MRVSIIQTCKKCVINTQIRRIYQLKAFVPIKATDIGYEKQSRALDYY